MQKGETEHVLSAELANAKHQGGVILAEDIGALIRDIRACGLSYTGSMVNIGLAALVLSQRALQVAERHRLGGRVLGSSIVPPSHHQNDDDEHRKHH